MEKDHDPNRPEHAAPATAATAATGPVVPAAHRLSTPTGRKKIMSEINYETGRTSPLQTVANWGETRERGEREPEQPDLPAGPLPAGYRGRRRRPIPRGALALIVGGLLLLLGGVLVLAGMVISDRASDPGVEFCEAIRDQEQGTANDQPLTFEEYQQIRNGLGDSRHEEIRVPALALVDVIWQFEQLGDDPGLEALSLVGSLTDSYSALSGGCAQHGIQLPPLETLS